MEAAGDVLAIVAEAEFDSTAGGATTADNSALGAALTFGAAALGGDEVASQPTNDRASSTAMLDGTQSEGAC